MLDICLLGTGGTLPLPKRSLSSLMLRYNGSSILIDVGEGTQVAIREAGWSFNPIDVICITHFHADHTSGLPGLLLSMGNSDRTEPITIVGPRGIEGIVNSLRAIAPVLPFDIRFVELREDFHEIELCGLKFTAFRCYHGVVCYGYSVQVPRIGKFDVEKAKKLEIPISCWNTLQHGNNVVVDDMEYRPDMVMGEDRKGLKVTYVTDTRPVSNIAIAAENSDLFICEGMYGDDAKLPDAKSKRHMLMSEAAELANQAGVKEMWLTHFSPSMPYPYEYEKKVKNLFSNAVMGRDRMMKTLNFDD